ncbi:c-type cytochrome domain-containing protein [Planctomycetes bacterium Poly30]|uniref:WD40 repeat domain-containing protein n=1 Tax=Saltatorellus ferox TaxID=2528018 RepID=UPI0011A4A60B
MALLLFVAPSLLSPQEAAPAQEPAQEPVSFERDLLPIFAAHCQGCHQPARSSGDVRLVVHGDLLGGDAPLVVPGSAAESLLLEVIASEDGLPASMPPEGEPLDAATVDLVRRWIDEGATDDAQAVPAEARNGAGEPIYTRPPVVTSLAYSPDGATLAVSGRGEVLLHRADAEAPFDPLARLVGLSDRIEAIAFSPDGARLAVSGGVPAVRGEVQIWDVAKEELLLSKQLTFDTLHGVSWSGDGTLVAVGCADHTVRVLEAATGKEVLFQGAHADWVLGTAFSSDDSHLITVSRDRSMKLIKVESQQFIDNITSITPGALRGGLMSVARRPGRDELLVGGADGAPKTYRTYREKKRVIGDDFNLLRAFERLPGRVFSVAWTQDGARFAAGSSLRGAGTVRFYDAEAEAPLWSRDVPGGVYTVACRASGREVAAGGFDGVVRIYSAEGGALLREFVPVPLERAESTETTDSTDGETRP